MYLEMVVTLIEELYVHLDDSAGRLLVGKLRGEVSTSLPSSMTQHNWDNPREALANLFVSSRLQCLRLTYRGLRRIEELRDILKRDRVLEPFGVLLDARYMHQDLENALRRAADTSVSVIYDDMDNFKPINDQFGHAAGDVVMKAYFEVVLNCIGSSGRGYRVGGDEVVAILIGIDHARAAQIAERIREGVLALKCEHDGKSLRGVTASIGVATTPP